MCNLTIFILTQCRNKCLPRKKVFLYEKKNILSYVNSLILWNNYLFCCLYKEMNFLPILVFLYCFTCLPIFCLQSDFTYLFIPSWYRNKISRISNFLYFFTYTLFFFTVHIIITMLRNENISGARKSNKQV